MFLDGISILFVYTVRTFKIVCITILVRAQVFSLSVADRLSNLRDLGQLYNTEAVEEFCHNFDNFLIYETLPVWKKLTERESHI